MAAHLYVSKSKESYSITNTIRLEDNMITVNDEDMRRRSIVNVRKLMA